MKNGEKVVRRLVTVNSGKNSGKSDIVELDPTSSAVSLDDNRVRSCPMQ